MGGASGLGEGRGSQRIEVLTLEDEHAEVEATRGVYLKIFRLRLPETHPLPRPRASRPRIETPPTLPIVMSRLSTGSSLG